MSRSCLVLNVLLPVRDRIEPERTLTTSQQPRRGRHEETRETAVDCYDSRYEALLRRRRGLPRFSVESTAPSAVSASFTFGELLWFGVGLISVGLDCNAFSKRHCCSASSSTAVAAADLRISSVLSWRGPANGTGAVVRALACGPDTLTVYSSRVFSQTPRPSSTSPPTNRLTRSWRLSPSSQQRITPLKMLSPSLKPILTAKERISPRLKSRILSPSLPSSPM